MDVVVDTSVAITIPNLDHGAGGGGFDEFVPTGRDEGRLTASIYRAVVAVAVRVALTFSF